VINLRTRISVKEYMVWTPSNFRTSTINQIVDELAVSHTTACVAARESFMHVEPGRRLTPRARSRIRLTQAQVRSRNLSDRLGRDEQAPDQSPAKTQGSTPGLLSPAGAERPTVVR
jgi:hypothetical protein